MAVVICTLAVTCKGVYSLHVRVSCLPFGSWSFPLSDLTMVDNSPVRRPSLCPAEWAVGRPQCGSFQGECAILRSVSQGQSELMVSPDGEIPCQVGPPSITWPDINARRAHRAPTAPL